MKGLQKLLLFCLLSLSVSGTVLADDITIHEYRAQCVVDDHGQAKLTVSVDMSIPTGSVNLDFPIGSGSGGVMSGASCKQVKTEEGSALRLREESGISGRRTFVFSYSMGQVIQDAGEGQKLSLDVIAPGWQWPMEKASFTINLPAPFTGTPTYVGGYRGDLVDDFWTFETTDTSIGGLAGEALLDHDELSVSLELPAGYVTIRSKLAGLITLLLILALGMACAAYWYLRLYAALPRVYLHTAPPRGAGAGDLPLIHSAASPSLPVQLTEWAALGYVQIRMGKKGRVQVERIRPMDRSRSRIEIWAFQNLFAKKDVCSCGSRRFAALCERYGQVAGSWWRKKVFSRRGGSPLLLRAMAAVAVPVAAMGAVLSSTLFGAPRVTMLVLAVPVGFLAGLAVQQGPVAYVRRNWQWMAAAGGAFLVMLAGAKLLGGFLNMAVAMGLQILAGLGTVRGGRRSKFGQAILSETLGFHRYLAHVDRKELEIRLRENGQFFYQLLPFAEAVGQGQIFAKGFGEIRMGPCFWLDGLRKPPRTAEAFYEVYQQLLRRMAGK